MKINKDNLKKNIPLITLIIVLIILTVVIIIKGNKDSADFSSLTAVGPGCNVGVVSIDGRLSTDRSEHTLDSLTIAREIRSLSLKKNDAMLILVDSGGGSAPAAEEISRALDEISVPLVTFVRGSALSGGYWVAAATDYIVALETAITGNIGVTASYLDEIELNKNEGYTFQEFTSGEFKEVFNVNKVLTNEHRSFLQDHVDGLFEIFAKFVMKNRNMSEEEFALVSDGKFYKSEKALELGLIDEIGGIKEIKRYLATQLSVDTEELKLCEPVEFLR